MDQTHIHLIITHLPIFGSILGAIVLVMGLVNKTRQTLIAGYIVLLISSLGALIAHQTGEAAEEAVEHLQGFSEKLIHEHEESAEIAFIAMIVLGLLSLVALFLAYRKSSYSYPVGWIIFIISLVSFGIIARTGYLGGQIRHTEISAATTLPKNDSD